MADLIRHPLQIVKLIVSLRVMLSVKPPVMADNTTWFYGIRQVRRALPYAIDKRAFSPFR